MNIKTMNDFDFQKPPNMSELLKRLSRQKIEHQIHNDNCRIIKWIPVWKSSGLYWPRVAGVFSSTRAHEPYNYVPPM